MSPQPGLEEVHFSFYAKIEMIGPPGGICPRSVAEAQQSVLFENPRESHMKIKEQETH